jgi:transcriptional regulator with GAF, ATPase, and Fis domain/CHASE2 domain-containing sensor protein
MIPFLRKISPQAYTVSGIFIFILMISLIPGDFNEGIQNFELDTHFRLRGERAASENMTLVHIGSEDIAEPGGRWPITRDYYGYLLHVLGQMEARAVDIDLLFTAPDPLHPEYDKILADFMESFGRVCLPMTFSSLTSTEKGIVSGIDPHYPHSLFRQHVSGIGFSNLGRELVIREVPLLARQGDEYKLSFGLEMARAYAGYDTFTVRDGDLYVMTDSESVMVDIDTEGRVLVNHFGNMDQMHSISLVNLLKTFRQAPDSLFLKDKLVVVLVTAPGVAPLVSTPLSGLIPASLVHATVAENMLGGRFIQKAGPGLSILFILIFIFAGVLMHYKLRGYALAVSIIVLLSSAVFVSQFLFNGLNFFLPLFYPFMGFLTTAFALGVLKTYQQRREEHGMRDLLQEQIDAKAKQLQAAKTQLAKLESQLSEEESQTQKSKELAEKRSAEIRMLEKELRDLKSYSLPQEEAGTQPEFKDIIHDKQSKMATVLNLVLTVAKDDIPVLIMGETGTGKEMIARTIHDNSHRHDQPFVAVNCGALSETLLESELFGHEKGSFTGAVSRRKGRFELAGGGTIFLDEITETSPSFQAKLLRVLQEGTFERLGGEQSLSVDIRVIAASNRDVQQEQMEGRFRQDLFYRLNGFPITIPPLRERKEDIPLLSEHFLGKYQTGSVQSLSGRVMELMQHYHWPGNVRELENVIRRTAILAQSRNRVQIREADLPPEIRKTDQQVALQSVHRPLEDQVLESLRKLAFSRSSIKQTAEALGNKDRGTITEYFRGICFEQLAENDFDISSASSRIADTSDEKIVERVQQKLNEYISNLVQTMQHDPDPDISSAFKGLPKKYHPALQKVMDHLRTKSMPQ